jgi:predicted small lipoprotein YifL
MNRIPFILALFLLVFSLIAPGCGKKGPPSLPKKSEAERSTKSEPQKDLRMNENVECRTRNIE